MNRRNFLQSLAAAPLVIGLLSACESSAGSDDKSGTGGGSDKDTSGSAASSSDGGSGAVASGLMKSNKARVAGTDPAVAADSLNRFSADLLAALQADAPTDNLVFSPLSIAVALAMTAAGAEGTTRDEMAKVLGFDSNVTYGSGSSVDDFFAAYQPSMNALLSALAERNKAEDNVRSGGDGVSRVQLEIANSLWGQAGLTFNPAFLDLLAEQYDAGIETVDYAANPEAARTTINKWVDKVTANRIPELLGQGTIDDLTRLVLVNAVYLKANWFTTFNEQNTIDATFTTAAGGSVQARMMQLNESINYAEGEGWQAVDLPYVFGDLSLVAVVADDATAATPSFNEVTSALSGGPVELSFPRFDFSTNVSLKSVLSKMGMPVAFSDDADFSAMTTDEQLHISEVVHQANITADENGTEAAAATAVVMATRSGRIPSEPVTITFDKPFTFWLRDIATGAVVFSGRVTDPSK